LKISITRAVLTKTANTMVPLARRTEGTDEILIFSNEIHHKAQAGVTTEDINLF
jgi:hypothetical protein